MKQEINLLPPAVARARVQRLYLQRVGQLLHRLLLILILLLALEGAIFAVLYLTDGMIQQNLARQDELTNVEMQAQLQAVNEVLTTAATHSSAAKPWAPLIAEVLTVLPSDMRISRLELEEKSGALVVAGTFTSRGSVRELQQRLEKLSWAQKVDAPLSNFATGDSQGFSFTLTRKP